MSPRRARRVTVLATATVLLGACAEASDDETAPVSDAPASDGVAPDDDAGDPEDASDPEDVASGVDAADVVPGGADDPVCPGYLDLLDITDLGIEPFREALLAVDAPDEVFAAIAVFEDEDATIDDFFAASDTVDRYASERCGDRYAADLVPAVSNEAALTVLREAIEQGDESAAATVAPTDVLARLRPWEGYPADDDTSYEVRDATMSAVLEPTVTLFCEADGGVVVRCAFGE